MPPPLSSEVVPNLTNIATMHLLHSLNHYFSMLHMQARPRFAVKLTQMRRACWVTINLEPIFDTLLFKPLLTWTILLKVPDEFCCFLSLCLRFASPLGRTDHV